MASIEILDTGFYTSLQDKGRSGHSAMGVPVSGAMDMQALEVSNLLLNNPPDTSVLECTLIGAKVKFLKDLAFVLTGAQSDATLDDVYVETHQVYVAQKSQTLTIGIVTQGCRTYLGIAGGFDSEIILGSRSMFYPITQEAGIKKGAQLKTGTSNFGSRKGGKIQMNKESLAIFQNELSVYKGPEYELLSSESREQLTELIFALSAFNRMGIALDPILEPHTHKMITGPVLPGTVQLTPSGRLFVLMRDCQTTGGYPRVLQLTQSAINALGQKKTGDKIRFLLE